MSEEAEQSWGLLYDLAHVDLKVWMAQTLLRCAEIETVID